MQMDLGVIGLAELGFLHRTSCGDSRKGQLEKNSMSYPYRRFLENLNMSYFYSSIDRQSELKWGKKRKFSQFILFNSLRCHSSGM